MLTSEVGTYLRLGPSHSDTSRRLDGKAALAFIDIDVPDGDSLDRLDDWLVDLLPSLIHYQNIIFRWPELAVPAERSQESELYTPRLRNSAAVLESALQWAQRARAGRLRALERSNITVLIHKVGAPPDLVVVDPSGNRNTEMEQDASLVQKLIRECRHSEVEALLRHGRARWAPTEYHFRLPSGLHSDTFLRVADAIRSPRDAFGLTTWLCPRLSEGLGFLLDTGSLTPLVVQAQSFMASSGLTAGPVSVLDNYPRTRLGANQAARHALGLSGGVAGLLSVSASGRLCDLFASGLESASPEQWSLDVVIDKSSVPNDRSELVVWASLGKETRPSEDAGSCSLCRDPRRSRVVNIDPKSMELFPLPTPERIIPDLDNSRVNRSLWRIATDFNGIALNTSGSSHAGPRPRHGRLGIRFLYDELFGDADGFRRAVEERLSLTGTSERERANRDVLSSYGGIEAVVLDEADSRDETGNDLREERFRPLLQAFGINDDVAIAEIRRGVMERTELELPEGVRHILVATRGSVTGWSLRRVYEIVAAKYGGSRRISGLVVHSRPVTRHDWELTISPFRNDCAYLWQTYLPWETPLMSEAQLLEDFDAETGDSGMSEASQSFLKERRFVVDPDDAYSNWSKRMSAFESGVVPDPRNVFWAQPSEPYSAFSALVGRDLSPIAAFVSVGSAVHSSREMLGEGSGSLWSVVDFTQLVRFRFNAIMSAAVLRWTKASESWWGDSPLDAKATMGQLIEVAEGDGEPSLEMFLAEALLASAQGKVDPAAVEYLTWYASERRSVPAIEAGLALVRWARPMEMTA